MTAKVTANKAKTAQPKAPPIVYVEIGVTGEELLVNADPTYAEDARSGNSRLARYKFDGFVKVELRSVVTDVPA